MKSEESIADAQDAARLAAVEYKRLRQIEQASTNPSVALITKVETAWAAYTHACDAGNLCINLHCDNSAYESAQCPQCIRGGW